MELDIPEGAARASFEDVMKKQPEKRMELLKLFIPDIKIFLENIICWNRKENFYR